jgi:hypothetical protein
MRLSQSSRLNECGCTLKKAWIRSNPWLNDRLPGLSEVHRSGLTFDLILLNAVFMHVPPGQRQRAFRKLITLSVTAALTVVELSGAIIAHSAQA